MTKIYHNRQSIRLKNYDYAQNGMYYVTICTKNRENILSEIIDVGADDSVRPLNKNNMPYSNINVINEQYILKLTEIGKIINKTWYNIPIIYDNVKLHEFVIMPNHIHGIIEIYNVGRTESSAPT